MATLQGAIDEFITVMDAVSGIQYVPPDPTEQVPVWPAAVVYLADGVSRNQPQGVMTQLHNVTIAFVMPLVDLAQCTRTMLSYAQSIPEALFDHRNGRTSAHYATFGDISHTLGPIEWPQGQEFFGYLFRIEGVKVQNEI